MPFITPEERKVVSQIPLPNRTAGQKCYLHYLLMVREWKKSPRWTTADKIYESVKLNPMFYPASEQRAKELAWQVFFQLHVMPYEIQKRNENGDI